MGSRIFMKRLKDESIFYTREEVLEMCNKCATCQEQKVSNLGRTAGQHIKCNTPWKQIALDTMGPMKVATSLGHRFAIVAVCMATGYSIVLTSKSLNALPVLQMLNLLTLALGPFPLLRTGNGTQYKNKRVEDWCASRESRTYSPLLILLKQMVARREQLESLKQHWGCGKQVGTGDPS